MKRFLVHLGLISAVHTSTMICNGGQSLDGAWYESF